MEAAKKICVITEFMTHYRISFFELLRKELSLNGYEFQVFYGQAYGEDAQKKDQQELPWANKIKNIYLKIPFVNFNVVYQPCLLKGLRYNLVIIDQENRLLINYIFLILRLMNKSRKIAFWGHGRNFQGSARSLRERFKSIYSNAVDWWFAYNNLSAGIIRENGFPEKKITALMNTLDTAFLRENINQYDQAQLSHFRLQLGIKTGPIGIYCGSFYKEKRITFIIDVVTEIQKTIPAFEMLFLGAGPDNAFIMEAQKKNSKIHLIGPKFHADRIPYFLLCDVQLMPGAVGLGIIDSFLFETPIFTTDVKNHGPEIDYLQNEMNGVITKNERTIYVNSLIDYLSNPEKLARLKKGCKESAEIYSLDNMVNRFVRGVKGVLNG